MAFRDTLRSGISISAFTATLALAGGLLPSVAMAQGSQQTTPEQVDEGQPVTDPDAAADDVIIVTGFRASLESAVAEKKLSDQIVESVTAEDIGKLPDASIGESIARLPGLTAQRLNGRANVVAIRGFGPDFSQTLLNGREQTTTSDNRSVELDQYPSEIVNQVVVYKSPTASLVGQGLVGTIDIRTIRPLETGKQIIAVGARGSWADIGALNAGSREYGYRVNGTFVDQFADDTIGISLAASYVDEPYQLQEFNAWGYAGTQVNGQDAALIGGSKSYVTSTRLKRLGVNGTLQWQPMPQLTLTVDGFYSNFDDDQSKRGIELPLGFGAFGTTFNPANFTVEDGLVTSGQFDNVRGVIRNDVFQRKADLYSGGFNALWDGDDGWTAFFDFGYSRTDRNELSLESYSGTGFNGDDTGRGSAATIGFTSGDKGTVFNPSLDYSDPARIFLTDPLGWGGGAIPQAGYSNNRIIEDELFQFRGEVEKEFDGGFLRSVQFGMNYTTREKSLTPDEAFVRLPNGATEVAIPSQFLLRSTDLTYLGLGPIVSYDPRELIAAGILVLEPRVATGPNAANDVLSKSYTVNEDLMTLYLQANIEQELANGVLTGNVGVQGINTVQNSTGFIFPAAGPQRLTLGDDYWDVLPSANLSLRLNSDWVFRVAAAREIMRPRLDDTRLSIGYGIDNSVPGGIIRGGGGNPYLRPYRANAIDFNIEKYFGTGGVVALQLFYKDIKSYVFNGRFAFDYSSFPPPTGSAAYPNLSPIGTLDAPINTGGGDLYGAELAVTLPFDTFSEALEGFGITGGASYTKTKIEDANGNETQIPGYSKWVVNGTAYFERAGFNTRVSARYRSTFLGDFTGFGGSPVRRTALDETIIDAQIGYDFQDGTALEGLSLYLQGQNLTDQPFVSTGAERNQVIDYQLYGRRFLAGFTYKF
ncbi:TonB-dependent receptor [Qipengyuania pelagi]|jgi:iron complex outermembrane receptor protein|uniref:TonB-dependent receptor n=1 Tax=Qipengyuania pelagi TaxID=994320 RepID=A0A844Y5F7_9SPHN|nr:TonB-dependent receptor [Qipengyuania pelagi]MXO53066.1 TonB-dependent receptor [Qipengyuania pelagi]